jgi:hypothetical protein
MKLLFPPQNKYTKKNFPIFKASGKKFLLFLESTISSGILPSQKERVSTFEMPHLFFLPFFFLMILVRCHKNKIK